MYFCNFSGTMVGHLGRESCGSDLPYYGCHRLELKSGHSDGDLDGGVDWLASDEGRE